MCVATAKAKKNNHTTEAGKILTTEMKRCLYLPHTHLITHTLPQLWQLLRHTHVLTAVFNE